MSAYLRKQIDELIQRNTPNEDRFSTREAIDQWCSTTSSWRNDSAKVSEPERQRGSTSPDNEQSESEDEKQRMHYHSDRSELTAELKVNRDMKSWQFHPHHKRICRLGIDLFSKKFRWEFLPLKSLFYAWTVRKLIWRHPADVSSSTQIAMHFSENSLRRRHRALDGYIRRLAINRSMLFIKGVLICINFSQWNYK